MCPRCEGFMCCSGCAVCTPRSLLCHQKLCSLISASQHGRHFYNLLFMSTHLSIHFLIKMRGSLGLFWFKPADSFSLLIRYCLRKLKSVPKGSVEIHSRVLIFMCNQWSSRCMVKQCSDLLIRGLWRIRWTSRVIHSC